MKKVLSIALCLVVALSVVACNAAPAEPAAPVLEGKYDLELATGGTGGTYYPFGGAIAQLFTAHLEGVTCSASATGASAENARLLNSKDSDLAILQNDVMDYAFKGIETMAGGGALTNIATIATLYPEVIQIVVTVESGINSIEDLKGKRVSVGDSGSGTEANARQILGVHGITYDDINESFLSFAESSTNMQNKILDAAFITAGVPNNAIMELSNMMDVKLISIAPDKADELIKQFPFYAKYTVEKDAYEKIDGCDTVAVMAALACSADLDENLIYLLTKTLFENQPELAQAHAKGASLELEKAVQGVSVPFHPGALKYYKEMGLNVG